MVNENQTLVLGSARGARCVVRDFHRADRIGGRPGHHAPPRPLIIRRNRYSHPAGTGSRRHPPTTSRCSDLATDATGCRNTGTAPSMRLLPSRTKCIGYCRVRRRANIHDRKIQKRGRHAAAACAPNAIFRTGRDAGNRDRQHRLIRPSVGWWTGSTRR